MTREFEVIQKQALKALSIYSMVVLLGGLFLSSIVEGLRLHLMGSSAQATLLYFAGIGSLAVTIYVYKKGREIIGA
ncbi:MAG TPA: hypothetical protein VJG83_03945 [archaeon]|nr:hypothetical protein [archaeon]